MTCSMMAWPRWSVSARSITVLLVEHGVMAPHVEQPRLLKPLGLLGRRELGFRLGVRLDGGDRGVEAFDRRMINRPAT